MLYETSFVKTVLHFERPAHDYTTTLKIDCFKSISFIDSYKLYASMLYHCLTQRYKMCRMYGFRNPCAPSLI